MNCAVTRSIIIALLALLSISFNTDCLVDYNRRMIGIREATGQNDGLYVRMFINYCGLHGDGYEWCAAFTLSGHRSCSFDFPLVNSCRADSWFPPDRVVYVRGDPKSLIKEGQVAGYFSRAKQYTRINGIGHNGTIAAVNLERNYALVVEGNSSDKGNLLQPGDGVHLLRRSLDEITYTADWQNKNIVRYHIVQPKETLYRISLMYKTTVAELTRINRLESNIISIGQKLRVG